MSTYYKVEIAGTSDQEAIQILDTLLEKRFVAGGYILLGETHHWWEGKIDTAHYYYVHAYITNAFKNDIEDVVRGISSEKVPSIVFFKIDDANKDFLEWIDENVK